MEDFNEAPRPQSLLHWYVSSIGTPTMLLIAGATLIAMVLVVVVFLRGRGPAVPAAIAFLLPLPLLVGSLALVGGSIQYLLHLGEGSNGPMAHASFSYALWSMTQASSCFCPLLMLGLTLLMVLGFRDRKPTG